MRATVLLWTLALAGASAQEWNQWLAMPVVLTDGVIVRDAGGSPA
jgi:hypothetical protein